MTENIKGRREYTKEEKFKHQMNMTTQGRKGCKAARINMAFAPDVYDYIKIMASVKGQTITEFVNSVIRRDIAKNEGSYQKVRGFIEGYRSSEL